MNKNSEARHSIHQPPYSLPKYQSGVALISTLLVFAIATILTAQMIGNNQASLKRTQWIVDDAQAWQHALGAEALAHIKLQQALTEKKPINTLFLTRTYPTSQGRITVNTEDLQSRINLNNIVADGGYPAVVRRLFQQQGAPQVIEPLRDWIDADSQPTGSGVEDNHYQYLQPSYRTANRPITDYHQLQALAGASKDTVFRMKPYVSSLPIPLPININTASATVINAIAPNLDGEQVVSNRDSLLAVPVESSNSESLEGFQSVESFLQSAATAGIELDSSVLTVKSHWYAILITARYGERTVTLKSRYNIGHDSETLTLWDRTSGLPIRHNTQEAFDASEPGQLTESPDEKDGTQSSSVF
ncbi:type II secretion system minor pseudopilin GspK [bacterium SCSIO 12696]|nr:type II secretion system minor pseudopilin GspK [bacterium SCSIO 12696]